MFKHEEVILFTEWNNRISVGFFGLYTQRTSNAEFVMNINVSISGFWNGKNIYSWSSKWEIGK